jgi:hypothetical protein
MGVVVTWRDSTPGRGGRQLSMKPGCCSIEPEQMNRFVPRRAPAAFLESIDLW